MHSLKEPHVKTTIITLAALASGIASLVLSSDLAQAEGGRKRMEQCVDHVLSRLVRTHAAEAQVGPAILSECDGALQAVLADAVESGEAPAFCKVAFCMTLARSRAAQEATEEYRRRVRS